MEDEALVHSGIALAQSGKIKEAGEILVILRAKYSNLRADRIAIRLMILEGLIWYYDGRRPESFDRIKRANLLASAGGANDLKLESSVWLSHLAFNFEEFTSLKMGVSSALRGIHLLTAPLQARICLVIADCNRFLGRLECGDSWYSLARIFSRKSADRSLIAAIEYNRVVMGLSRARLERFLPQTEASNSSNNWSEEFSSIRRLHHGMGVTSLAELLLLGEAFGYQVDGEFGMAVAPLIAIKRADAAAICGMSSGALDLEILWSQVMGGVEASTTLALIPSLEAVDKWTLNEQFTGLMQLRDISDHLDIQMNREQFDLMSARALDHCRRTISDMDDAIADADDFQSTVRQLCGLK